MLDSPTPNALADPSAYVSPLTSVLRRARWVVLTSLVVWSALCFFALASIATATKTIGEDTAHSIVDAEQMRALLADANAQLAKATLVNDGKDGRFASALRQDMRDAETVLIDAASRITFGAEESGPIVTIARGIADYERLVGAAQGSDTQARIASALAADAVMHFTILPAAETLDRVKLAHLTEGYQNHLATKLLRAGAMAVASLVLLVLLIGLQLYLFRMTKRIINPGLFATTTIVLCFSIFAGLRFAEGSHAVYVAKEQAFDSIGVLTKAQAIAHDTDAAQSYWLLARGDAGQQAKFAAAFAVRAAHLVPGDVDAAVNAATTARSADDLTAAARAFKGLLGDELANITFTGERKAATETLRRWAAYTAIDRHIRAEAAAGRMDAALALTIGDGSGQSPQAFLAFDTMLGETIGINRAEFDAAIARSEDLVDHRLYGLLAVAWLAGSVTAWLGIAQRLKRYAF